MSEQDYTKKMEALRRYIPFLINMMAELKAKGNREAQLAKIQSLHDMITDTRKKLKLDTLKRCEEVLTNIYFKVNPQLRGSKTCLTTLPGIESPSLTPQSPSPPRDVILTKPITIPTEKVPNQLLGSSAHKSPKSHRPKIDVYSNAVIDSPTKTQPPDMITKVPDMSKPPISLDDLRNLEDDVQQKINDAAFGSKSVDELQEVRKQLQLQLRVDEVTSRMSPEKPNVADINTTVRNNPTFSSKRLSYSESKQKQNKEMKSPSSDKKTQKHVIKDSPTSNKSSKKHEDIFGSLLSSIDGKLLEDKKKSKKHDRRPSKEDGGSTTSLSSDKSDGKSRDSSKHRRSSSDKDKTKDKKRDESRDKSKSDKSKSEKKHHKDNKEKKDEHKLKETKDKDTTLNSSKSSSETDLLKSDSSKSSSETDLLKSSDSSKTESTTKEEVLKDSPTFKRLADKYKPKPKPKLAEADVEKSVSASIEQLMKVSPVKALTSPVGALQSVPQPVPQPVPPPKPFQEDTEQKKPVQLPDILQKIFSKPLLGDIIPKRLTEPISPLAQNRAQNSSAIMTKPGAIQPPEPPVLSPPHRPLQFKPPPGSLSFVAPPQMLSPDMVGRHTHVTSPAPGIGQIMPNTAHGLLPTPPIPPALPDMMNVGYGTPRMDFDAPGTPMPDFASPRMDFEQPGFMRNDQFNMNQRFMPVEHQMHGYDPRNANQFMGHQNMYVNQGHNMAYYGSNQMPMHNPEVPHYMPDQTFYQERARWVRDRYPGDPRNYKEYKEMKERQERAAQEKQREAQEKQREIKDPRLALRDPRLSKEATNEASIKDKPETAVRDPRLSRPREKSVERPRNNEFKDARDGGRSRRDDNDRSRESRPRSRYENSKFDQMYSRTNRGRSPSRSRGREDADKSEDEFASPLDSLYNAGEKGRTGRGYGVQNFRIPRKPKSAEETRREERSSSSGRQRRRLVEISDSDESDSNNVDDGAIPDNDSDMEIDDSQEAEVKTINEKDELEKDAKSDLKIEVVIKPGDDFWKTESGDDFVSEYDKEFQSEIKPEEPISKSPEKNTNESKIQVEEPSSSQDVVEQSPKKDSPVKAAETTDTFTKPAEPDSSKKPDGAATPQETTSKHEEPSEQNILAQFFQNLLKSSNKNDKKTALFSLIETFSDSFEDKEIQKIRKIIKANEEPEAASDEEKEEAKAEPEQESATKTAAAQEEQPVVGSTTEEEVKDATPEVDEAATLSINETQVHEVSKSTDESIEQEKSEESLIETKDRSLEPVMVSVGERIKNRRRKKFKTELDLLHENIQEMFIRDGVLTATGKRMCRILKDDPNVLANDSEQAPTDSAVEEQPKKLRKKPGPKPKQKPVILDNAHASMKDVRVLIKKMPDDVLNTSTRQLRNRTRQSSYAENEDEADSIHDDVSFASSIDGETDKSDLEAESANETETEEDKSLSATEVVRKPRIKRRKVPKWASGIISKVKKKKALQSKSKESSPERIPTPAPSATSDVASLSELDLDTLGEPDRDYYYDYTIRRKLKCKLCKYKGHLLTGHYLKEHPHSEVLCSRFAPERASEAIKDIAENGEILERIAATNQKSKYNYSCRLCGFTSCISSIFFYEHVTTHTGEYRHQCGICEFAAVTSKTMKVHFAAVHPDQEKKVIVKTYSPPVVFAYICEDCNFVQLKEKSVQDHVNIFHLGKKPSIHKISMSSVIDPVLKAVVEAETESAAKPDIIEDTAEETPKRKKPGPKSKKEKLAAAEKEKAAALAAEEEKELVSEPPIQTEATEKDTTTPVRRKKPGPKSKTLPIPETTETPSQEVEKRSLRKRAGPKSKTSTPKLVEESAQQEDTAQQENTTTQQHLDAPTPPPENAAAKEVPARKRRRSLDKLINEDSGDDLDTIITLSSRSTRAAKEKATAKLKTLMENNEVLPPKRKPEVEPPKSDDKEIEVETEKDVEAEKEPAIEKEAEEEAAVETEEAIEPQKEQHQVAAMHPPTVNNTNDDAANVGESSDKDQNVFTCKNDILQEDAKKIEEDRLRKMDELNKSIISRTLKHDFINKLSNRLTNEEQSNETSPVQVKAEPKDASDDATTSATTYEPIVKPPPITKVAKSPALSRKPVFEEEPTAQQPSIKFRQNKPNSLFSNMIEKLQGKVNEAAVQEDNSNLASSIDETTSNDSQNSSSVPEAFISVGDLIRATKIDKEIIYSCHANKCYVATKDKMVFQLHCKFGHKELNLKSSLCDRCGVVVEVTRDTTLLENLYDHLVFAHSDFLTRSTLLRMRRLSGDKLSIKKEQGATPATNTEPQDFELLIQQSTEVPMETTAAAEDGEQQPPVSEATLEFAEDNPFSFKIESVMSLADSNDSTSPVKATSKVPAEASPKPQPPPLKHVPPLMLIGTGPKPTSQSLVVKEAKLTPQELSRPKKAAKALQRFINCPQDLYKCPHFYCMFSSKVRTLMMCHLKAHTCDNDTMVPCVYCNMKTPWRDVPMHIELRHASCKYACSYCLYRAVLKEYVCLHQEQCHPNLDYIIICLQIHKSVKKFSVTDSKNDPKTLFEPFRCLCKDKEDGEPVMHEYLFESEFAQHLRKAHPLGLLACGYPKCTQKELNSTMMLNHWATFHGVCVYQCGHCKVSSNDMARMYLHFSQIHPSLTPNIFVRKNDFLSEAREVRFSDEAFQLLGYVRKISPALLNSIAKRTNRTVKLIQLDNLNGTPEDGAGGAAAPSVPPTTTIATTTTASCAPVLFATSSASTTNVSAAPKLLVPTSNVKLLVATSTNSDKLYLLPAMMAPVTSTAPMNKVLVQTSSASRDILKATDTVPKQPVKFGGITLYPSDDSEIFRSVSSQKSVVATAGSSFVTSTSVATAAAVGDKDSNITAKIKSISKVSMEAQENEARDDLASENDSTALSEDDMLQSAIQSILDQEDDDTRLENNITNTTSERPPSKSHSPLLAGMISDPPPLVFINNSTSATSPRPSTPVEAPIDEVEHVDVAGRLPEEDFLESNEESIPFFNNDSLDPLSEDPLNITPTLNTNLPVDDPLSIDETTMDKVNAAQQNIQPPESVMATQEPLKITTMRRSASMVSNSDDESDGSASDKKKRGLIGYQLFRCAACNLSFSNLKPFKSHITSSLTCKKPGFRGFQCAHCDKGVKTPQRLTDHIMTHGLERFSCSLCNEKFTTVGIAKLHMKNRHSIPHTNLLPLNPANNNMDSDNFVIKPSQANAPVPKDKEPVSESPKSATEDSSYTPEMINSIPIRQIFSSNVKCRLCNYQTKVRVNIIRHLQMHLEEKAVSDTAPVNPVPCLEKNEKMFDKMINLAASSITTTTRMGGTVKDKEKEEEKYPEFVPSHRRFVCCAQGCSYLCPEEANLKHHLMALHSDEINFTCAHCKIKIEPTEIESVIKHFKVHGLHLYKCHYCSFIHHLKHKVEKHILDGHLDMAVKVVTIRYMESEPQEFVPQEEVTATPPQTTSSKFKPWNCGMCKAKYHAREDIQAHIIKKHNIDAQYKCTLCAFKNDEEDSFKAHFQEKHPNHELDIIFVYQKIEEELPKEDSGTPFDTTPLWQRDKPRVRHIRGIFFDEALPQPTKSPKKVKTYGRSSAKTSANTTPKASPVVSVSSSPKVTPSASTSVSPVVDSVSKNLFDCIEAVARGTADTLMNKPGSSGVSPTKKASPIQEPAPSSTPVVTAKIIPRKKSVSAAKKEEIKPETAKKEEIKPETTKKEEIKPETTVDDDVVVVPQTSSIIVIDSDESDSETTQKAQSKDDDTPKTKDKDSKTKPMAKNRGQKRPGGATDLLEEAVKMAKIEETDDEDCVMASNCSAQNLISLYGELGTPHNKQWMCPKCNKFKSKRVGDFMFHIYKDFNTYRYRCKVCLDLSITYKYMVDHIKLHARCNEDIIEPLTPNFKLETWIHMVVREQSLVILKNAPLFKKRPIVGQTDITCYFCNDKFMSMPECCEHMLYHWVMMPYQCQHCPHEFYTIYDLKHHHKIEHPDAKLYTDPKGPTLSRAIQCIENPKKRPFTKFAQSLASKKKPRLDDSPKDPKRKKEEITSGIVINAPKGKRPQKPSPAMTDAVITLDDDEDDLVIVSKTDDRVPNEDNVFACDICAFLCESEIFILKHLAQEHGVRTNKFHILSKKLEESETALEMACNICNEVFSELKLRKHFIQNHFTGQTYAPYRYKCLLCPGKFLTVSRLKVHFTRAHPDEVISYQCIIPSMKVPILSTKVPKQVATHKQYFCTFCSYSTVSTTTVTIRGHLKAHLKPILCTKCNARFRYHKEVVTHCANNHPEQIGAQYVTLDDVMSEFSETMKLIIERAVVTSADNIDAPLKSIAKKSTSARFPGSKSDEDEPGKELDLSKIRTTFELDQLEYTTTAEQMQKMFNMDTYVDLSDCTVDIMPLDNS